MFVTRSPQSAHVLGAPSHPYGRRHRAYDRPRFGHVRVALLARWHSIALDHQLADGADPESSPALATRAAQLTSRRSRRRVAGGLAGAFQTALHPRPRFTAALPPQSPELLDARVVVTTLTRRLYDPEPVGVRGVAMLTELLTDVASPLYQNEEPGLLGSRLRAAAAALESPDPSTIDARTLTRH